MLDPKFIRENQDLIREALKNRNDKFDFDSFLSLDDERRILMHQKEELSAAQNNINEDMKTLIKEKKDATAKIEEGKDIKKRIALIDGTFADIDKKFKDLLLRIPNVPHASIPVGHPDNNKIVKTCGEPRKFEFKPLDHITLSENLDIIDFKRAAKITGSNFVLFKGYGARLVRALINYMLDTHTQSHGYKEVSPPIIVNRDSMRSTGQLPKLEEDMYRITEDDLFLIPTAEVPVTNIHRDEILDEASLPIYYTAYTPCFRREAGTYGKDTRGLVRVHQFDKVELVKFVKPADSYDELEKLLGNACFILEQLRLPYRVLMLATGDISFAAAKCYDIELHAPGIDRWLEVSSCSNFEDFQARRGNIRFREKESGKLRFVHTLNGSGLALARLVVAIIENYQNHDGSITIPEVLRRYFDGRESISVKA